MKNKQINLTIESRLENVSLVSNAVNNICAHLPINPDEAHIIELCVNEAVVNCIKHAYRNEPERAIEIELVIEPSGIVIRVMDSGIPMNPELLSRTPSFDEDVDVDNLDAVPASGRGLMIIKSHMDSVDYQIEQTKNTLTMSKNITFKQGRTL